MEILDIVQRLVYEADLKSLEDAEKAMESQITTAANLQKRINSLEDALSKTGENDIKRRERLSAIITKQKIALEDLGRSIVKQVATNDKLAQSLGKAGSAVEKAEGKFNSLQFSIGNLVRDSPSFANGISQGFLAISNNIGPAFDDLMRRMRELKAEGKPVSLAFKDIGGALFGVTGLINLGVLALTLFGDKLFNTKDKADELTGSLEDFNKQLSNIDKQARQSAANEITELRILEETATNVANSQELRVSAAKKLLDIYPELNKQTDQEGILNGKAANAINAVAAALINKANAEAASRKLSALADRDLALREEEVKATDELLRNRKKFNELNAAADKTNNQYARNAAVNAAKELQNSEDKKRAIRSERQEIEQQRQDLLNYQQTQQQLATTVLGVGKEIEKSNDKPSGKGVGKIAKVVEETDGSVKILERDIKDIIGLIDEVEGRSPKPKTVPIPTQQPIDDTQKIKDRAEAQKAAYAGYINTLQVINSLLAQQQQLLDRQYETQRQRVEQATLLAERGNAAELKSEQEKLDGIARKREENAKKQVQINAILQASNSAVALTEAIGAVVKAATAGDPYTIAARIFAAVAALVAGVASVKSAFSGFAEGGYTGDGGKYQVAGTVHKGEFVMTKEKTAMYRPMLEAMHKGTFPVMPMAAGGTLNTKKLEKKLDGVINAVEENRLRQNIFFNEHGVGIMTERTMNKNRKRWM